jgi:hypothetical protein
MVKAKPKMGRPSIFTDKMATTICVRLADGESLRAICADEGMPNRNTVRVWTQEKPDFSSRYARARAEGMYALAELALERASVATQEDASAVRVYVDTVKWFAAKMAPAAFGDKAAIDINAKVEDSGEKPQTALQLAREIAFALSVAMRSTEATPSIPDTPKH